MAEAPRYISISLDNIFNSMVDQVYLTRFLTVQMKRSISGTCSFLGAQFKFLHRDVSSLCSDSNSQSVCMFVVLKPCCRYNLCTCVITSAMFYFFRFLIILPVAKMTFRDIVLRNPIPLVYMRSQQMVTPLYWSRMVLGTHVILTGSTCWILRRSVFPSRCGIIGP